MSAFIHPSKVVGDFRAVLGLFLFVAHVYICGPLLHAFEYACALVIIAQFSLCFVTLGFRIASLLIWSSLVNPQSHLNTFIFAADIEFSTFL